MQYMLGGFNAVLTAMVSSCARYSKNVQ